MPTALIAISIVVAAFLVAFAALVAFALLAPRKPKALRALSDSERDSIVFVFEDEILRDATPAARQMFDTAPRTGSDWTHFAELLAPRFPGLSDTVKDLVEVGELTLTSGDGSTRLHAVWREGLAHFTLTTENVGEARARIDTQSLIAMSQELDSLRAISDRTPFPLWRESAPGHITWCNAAYLALSDAGTPEGSEQSWPPAPVFDLETGTQPELGPTGLRRTTLSGHDEDQRRWFEIGEDELPNGDRFYAAYPADEIVKAESSLREFITTLTKTFASLPIGLAIFDRERALALFNPALIDLTLLPAGFLVSRPSLSAFLDKLREARMMPEPRDYKSWRQQISDLVAAAEDGSYEETWTLPTGQTYRVTGRPHPEGAVALLFEDISAEVSATRRYRTELEIGQAALDALPQAVAVFTSAGVLSMTNAAYAELWGRDPSSTLDDITFSDALKSWIARSAPSLVWDRIRAYTTKTGPREAWQAQIALSDGRGLTCTISPLALGATMVAFLPAAGAANLLEYRTNAENEQQTVNAAT